MANNSSLTDNFVKALSYYISDVLNMTVEEAVVFFANQPKIARKLHLLH